MSTSTPQGQCPKCNQLNTYNKVVCEFCGARLPWAQSVAVAPPLMPSSPPKSASSSSSGANILGLLLFIGGAIAAGYFFFVFDTSVAVPSSEFMGMTIGGGRVNNIGLMQDRQNGLLLGIGAMIVGAIFLALGSKKNS